jgi:hypothetical protein
MEKLISECAYDSSETSAATSAATCREPEKAKRFEGKLGLLLSTQDMNNRGTNRTIKSKAFVYKKQIFNLFEA